MSAMSPASPDRPSPDIPAIACKGVWQVFGDQAERRLTEALAATDTAADAAAMLKDQGLIPAVQDAGFDVFPGELFVIMGLSGSGKSTLVRGISRLIEATAGRIEIDGEDIRTANVARMTDLRRRKLGMVFQHFGLFPHMTVAGNVTFPLKMQGAPIAERQSRAREVIQLVGLDGREDAYPRELSGGQRQRVGIARSLAVNPDIWLLDEPFSALDPLIRRQLQDEFLYIQATLKKSIVFITHDIAEALKLADRIAIMKDGAIVQIGTPAEIVLKPVNSYVAEFSRDVVRGRHARVASIMRGAEDLPTDDTANSLTGDGLTGDSVPGDSLRPDMTLEDALAACMTRAAPVPVRDRNGKLTGMVHPSDLAAAMRAQDG